MQDPKVVSREEWLVARKEHLAKEVGGSSGLDILNGTCHYMDLATKGCDEYFDNNQRVVLI